LSSFCDLYVDHSVQKRESKTHLKMHVEIKDYSTFIKPLLFKCLHYVVVVVVVYTESSNFTEIPMTVGEVTLFFFLRDYILIKGL